MCSALTVRVRPIVVFANGPRTRSPPSQAFMWKCCLVVGYEAAPCALTCRQAISNCPFCQVDMRGTEEKGVDTRMTTAMISLAWYRQLRRSATRVFGPRLRAGRGVPCDQGQEGRSRCVSSQCCRADAQVLGIHQYPGSPREFPSLEVKARTPHQLRHPHRHELAPPRQFVRHPPRLALRRQLLEPMSQHQYRVLFVQPASYPAQLPQRASFQTLALHLASQNAPPRQGLTGN